MIFFGKIPKRAWKEYLHPKSTLETLCQKSDFESFFVGFEVSEFFEAKNMGCGCGGGRNIFCLNTNHTKDFSKTFLYWTILAYCRVENMVILLFILGFFPFLFSETFRGMGSCCF